MTTNDTNAMATGTTALEQLTDDQILDEGYLTASRLKELLEEWLRRGNTVPSFHAGLVARGWDGSLSTIKSHAAALRKADPSLKRLSQHPAAVKARKYRPELQTSESDECNQAAKAVEARNLRKRDDLQTSESDECRTEPAPEEPEAHYNSRAQQNTERAQDRALPVENSEPTRAEPQASATLTAFSFPPTSQAYSHELAPLLDQLQTLIHHHRTNGNCSLAEVQAIRRRLHICSGDAEIWEDTLSGAYEADCLASAAVD